MYKNYFKLALRNFVRQKVTSSIYVLGFTIGIFSCFLIGLYIRDELSFDQFHENKQRIYRMSMDLQQQNGNRTQTAFSPAPWAPVMTESFPEITVHTRFMRYRLPVAIHHKESQQQYYERDFLWADASVFKVFSFPLIKGNPTTALSKPHTVVISESAAQKFFANENPLGKILSYEGREDLTVTGVFKDFPTNSHLKAEFLASFTSLNNFWDIIDNWWINYYYTYFLLNEGSDIQTVAEKMPTFIEQHLGEEGIQRFHPQLQALTDIHLYSKRENELEAGGNGQLLYLFAAIAFLIFLIAGANYVNLATAGAVKRAKEIGIRKVLGSQSKQLVFQFLGESIFQIGIALVLAILLTMLILPYFNAFTGKDIQILSLSNDYLLLLSLLGFSLLFGLLAGVYPAFYLARLQPIESLKKAVGASSLKMRFRQFIVVFQFGICAALIVGALVINAQFKYLTSKDLGFSKDQTLLFRLNGDYLNDAQNIQTFKKQLLAESGVKSASIASHRIVGDQPYYGRYQFDNIPQMTEPVGMGRLHIDEDFISTYDIPIIAGRDLDKNRVADTSSFLINKTAMQRLGLKDPEAALGKLISYETRGANGTYLKQGPIVGVTDDFHFRSLHFQVEPMVMDIQPARNHFIAIKLEGNNIAQNIQNLEGKWQHFFPDGLFEYQFLDEQLMRQYELEHKTNTLFSLFSAIGVLIACLGLFGLATFITSQRIKEIGVRKILGARPIQILTLLSKDVLQLILVALCIGLPLSWYVMQQWLADFSYRIDLHPSFFLITAIMSIVIALLTIGLQALKAILANPVQVLKQE
jgi:putative ABC transport system permease protein